MYVKTIHSETELWDDFIHKFREFRQVGNFSLYLEDGIDRYYDAVQKVTSSHVHSIDDRFASFIEQHLDKSKHYTLVSLGCGDASKEKPVLDYLVAADYQLDYVGVDVSLAALGLADKQLAHLGIAQRFINADFMRDEFTREMRESLPANTTAIYALYGGTISNLSKLEYVGDVMADLLRPGDMLWPDVGIREGMDELANRKYFERYRDYARTPARQRFYFNSLEKVGIPYSAGSMELHLQPEPNTGGLQFNFVFRLKERAAVRYRGHAITLMPDEAVLLTTIRIFDPESFVRFFVERGFTFVGQDLFDGSGQFLLVR